jgi:hypothetical protein
MSYFPANLTKKIFRFYTTLILLLVVAMTSISVQVVSVSLSVEHQAALTYAPEAQPVLPGAGEMNHGYVWSG